MSAEIVFNLIGKASDGKVDNKACHRVEIGDHVEDPTKPKPEPQEFEEKSAKSQHQPEEASSSSSSHSNELIQKIESYEEPIDILAKQSTFRREKSFLTVAEDIQEQPSNTSQKNREMSTVSLASSTKSSLKMGSKEFNACSKMLPGVKLPHALGSMPKYLQNLKSNMPTTPGRMKTAGSKDSVASSQISTTPSQVHALGSVPKYLRKSCDPKSISRPATGVNTSVSQAPLSRPMTANKIVPTPSRIVKTPIAKTPSTISISSTVAGDADEHQKAIKKLTHKAMESAKRATEACKVAEQLRKKVEESEKVVAEKDEQMKKMAGNLFLLQNRIKKQQEELKKNSGGATKGKEVNEEVTKLQKANEDLSKKLSSKENLLERSKAECNQTKRTMEKLAKDFEAIKSEKNAITLELEEAMKSQPFMGDGELQNTVDDLKLQLNSKEIDLMTLKNEFNAKVNEIVSIFE